MQLAFCLYKYFPYGGLQRQCLRIAKVCRDRGHQIRFYVLEWTGDEPEGMELVRVPVKAMENHRRYARFNEWLQSELARRPVDRVVGFNKMPGLDVYYAADPCFEEKARTLRSRWYRLGPRYRHFARYERAVFGPESRTQILSISRIQQALFMQHYGTPRDRFHEMPPGIAPDRRAPPNAAELRAEFRATHKVADNDLLLLHVGSDFPRKGLDRSIAAMASLPDVLRARSRLFAIGEDKPDTFLRQAKSLGIDDRVWFAGGRTDVPSFLLGADLLLHPARHENTGGVLLEALASGLPVLASEACGYAHYIVEADAGAIVPHPFSQEAMNSLLADMLADDRARRRWHNNALHFADTADIYSLPERAADVILGDIRN